MAKLLCIKNATLRDGINEIGDIVGVFPDTHVFSQAEIDGFDIVKITSDNVDKTYTELLKLMPENPDIEKSPKYKFKVTNKTALTIDTAVVCKVSAKSIEP